VPAETCQDLIEFLKQRGVPTGIHFPGAHEFSLYRNARRGDLSVTDRVTREELTLPLWSYMDEAGLDRVAKAITAFFSSRFRRPATPTRRARLRRLKLVALGLALDPRLLQGGAMPADANGPRPSWISGHQLGDQPSHAGAQHIGVLAGKQLLDRVSGGIL
jgi:hypothetical protein